MKVLKLKKHLKWLLGLRNLSKILFLSIVAIGLVTLSIISAIADQKKLKYGDLTETSEIKQSKALQKGFLKVVHLDLKGGAPKLAFLLKLLTIIRKAGANAILIEYEDMFPFSGTLTNISASNAYPLKEIKKFIEFAGFLKMEVIPLVQTFGHLEYVLKLEEFRDLRELESFPQEICPLNKKAVDLVKEMIRQCMAAHPNSKYIHIGCDEVRHIGACPRCSRTKPKKLFADHVSKIADFIRSTYPGVTPLIWDDMLRRWTFPDIANSGLGSVVEPVVWAYGENIFSLVPPLIWRIYHRTFPRLWVASAFKGAFGETETLPDLTRHLENHLSWMKILSGDEEDIPEEMEITGIFLTGWSRYDHFAVLCELLPVSIPSLILGLTFLDTNFKERNPEAFSKWLQTLRCPPDYINPYVKNETYVQYKLGDCSFPGNNLYSMMIQFKRLRARVRNVIKTVEFNGWTSQYNLERNFTSPWRLLQMFPEEGFAGEVLKRKISNWKVSFSHLMRKYFDLYTCLEWEEQNIKPLEEKLLEIQKNFQNLIGKKTWPRRPLR